MPIPGWVQHDRLEAPVMSAQPWDIHDMLLSVRRKLLLDHEDGRADSFEDLSRSPKVVTHARQRSVVGIET